MSAARSWVRSVPDRARVVQAVTANRAWFASAMRFIWRQVPAEFPHRAPKTGPKAKPENPDCENPASHAKPGSIRFCGDYGPDQRWILCGYMRGAWCRWSRFGRAGQTDQYRHCRRGRGCMGIAYAESGPWDRLLGRTLIKPAHQ